MPQHQTRLSETLEDAMKDQGVSIRDLAQGVGVTYETIRGMLRGQRSPAQPLLRQICSFLQLPYEDVAKLHAADTLERKFGDVPALMAGKNPELAGIERYWDQLKPEQKTDLTELARNWAQRNK